MAADDEHTTLLKGRTGQYTFPEKIIKRKGKFNRVFLGRRHSDHAKVLIKELNPSLSDREDAVALFAKEFAAGFEHQGVVSTLEYIEQNGRHYIVRQYEEGCDLKQLRHNRRLLRNTSLVFWLQCGIETLKILTPLHEEGIIHRDIRPSNILFLKKNGQFNWQQPEIKLLDLGMAQQTDERQFRKPPPFALMYSPPEMVLQYNHLNNATTDVFSLGITLYELITGHPPFRHTHPAMLINLQLVYPLPKHPKIPPPLFDILNKATTKYRFPKPPNRYRRREIEEQLKYAQSQRYASASLFQADLEEFLETGARQQTQSAKKPGLKIKNWFRSRFL